MIKGIFRLEDDGDIVTAVEYMCDDKGLNDQAKVTAIRMVVKDL
jgi:hypothetical protein